jgi:hypothetical protein
MKVARHGSGHTASCPRLTRAGTTKTCIADDLQKCLVGGIAQDEAVATKVRFFAAVTTLTLGSDKELATAVGQTRLALFGGATLPPDGRLRDGDTRMDRQRTAPEGCGADAVAAGRRMWRLRAAGAREKPLPPTTLR